MGKPVEAVLLGAGNRGFYVMGAYAQAHPDKLRIVAVAEPDEGKRARAAAAFGVAPERQFARWQDALAAPQLAPVLLNTTMDKLHLESTVAALDAGYDVLCEKPMATTPQECIQLVRAAERTGRMLQICHVMRYTPFWQAIKRVLDSGQLGDMAHISHSENVSFWHFAHSFVRGNWGNSVRSAPMILAKSCHDMDMLAWQVGSPCVKISSVGSLTHFRPEGAPAGAGQRCLDCAVERECPYSAVRRYLEEPVSWTVSAMGVDQSEAGIRHAIETGPWGQCVYHHDNDQPDHMAVLLEFANGTTVNFTMHGLSHENCRTVRYCGSHGTLRGHDGNKELWLRTYLPRESEDIAVPPGEGGHGGGDVGLLDAFVATYRGEGDALITSARESLASHLMAFAAEESRLTGQMIDFPAYVARVEAEVAAGELARA